MLAVCELQGICTIEKNNIFKRLNAMIGVTWADILVTIQRCTKVGSTLGYCYINLGAVTQDMFVDSIG